MSNNVQQFLKDKKRNIYSFSLKESKKDGTNTFQIGTAYKFIVKKDFKVISKDAFLTNWCKTLNSLTHDGLLSVIEHGMQEYAKLFSSVTSTTSEPTKTIHVSKKSPKFFDFPISKENLDIFGTIFSYNDHISMQNCSLACKKAKEICDGLWRSHEYWRMINASYERVWNVKFPESEDPRRIYKDIVFPLLRNEFHHADQTENLSHLPSKTCHTFPSLDPWQSIIHIRPIPKPKCISIYRFSVSSFEEFNKKNSDSVVRFGFLVGHVEADLEENLHWWYLSQLSLTNSGLNLIEMCVDRSNGEMEISGMVDGIQVKFGFAQWRDPDNDDWGMEPRIAMDSFLSPVVLCGRNLKVSIVDGPGRFGLK